MRIQCNAHSTQHRDIRESMKDTSKMAQWYQQTYSQQQGHFNFSANQNRTLEVTADVDQSKCTSEEGFLKICLQNLAK
jgi:hypothetical protein